MKIWAASSQQRVFPWTTPRRQRVRLLAACGERVSFQVAFRHEGEAPIKVSASADAGDLPVRVRVVGLVPVPHSNTNTPADESDLAGRTPCFVPDPLLESCEILQEGGATGSFWLSIEVPPGHTPGEAEIKVTVSAGGRPAGTVTVPLRIADATSDLKSLPLVTHWFYADALCDWYRIKPFEEAFWPILDRYLQNYVAHGCNTLYVPAFTPPLDGVKRPTQLLRVTRAGKDRYRFDWSDVERWIAHAKSAGVQRFEWSHLFTQWGCKHAIRVYQGDPNEEKLLWDPATSATDAMYRRFLQQYIGELETFLKRKGLMNCSVFHISDEPQAEHRSAYRAAREMMREIAPWMRFMDALSDVNFAIEGLVDDPVSVISQVHEFHERKLSCFAYFCCHPRGRYLNRLLDTPLAKIRMSGWLLHRMKAKGFLHWGYNYWYKSQTRQLIDPYFITDGLAWPNWAHGDTFVVYPGPDGAPVDSIRWEVFAESLQDWALLRGKGIDPDSRSLLALRSFGDFPKTPEWIVAARSKLLAK